MGAEINSMRKGNDSVRSDMDRYLRVTRKITNNKVVGGMSGIGEKGSFKSILVY